MKNNLNNDVVLRDNIIFDDEEIPKHYTCGLASFYNLTLEKLEKLIENKFIDLDGRQNFSPTVGVFLDFMKKYPFIKAHGYAVCIERDDYRVTLEGLICKDSAKKYITSELQDEFKSFSKRYRADIVKAQKVKLYSWWD